MSRAVHDLLCKRCRARAVAGQQYEEELGGRAWDYCAPCAVEVEDEQRRNPHVLLSDQTIASLDHLDSDPDSYVRWPFHQLDALTGPLAPGNVYFVAAISGGGKSTLMGSVVDRWFETGVKQLVMPLEIRPQEWRIQFACIRLGIRPGDALSGELRLRDQAGDLQAQLDRRRIGAELVRLGSASATADRLYISPDSHVTLAMFEKNVALAAEHGMRVVVVDHVDHLAPEAGGRSAMEDSRKVCLAAHSLAQKYNLIIVLTSQLNLDLAREGGASNRLAKYAAPQVQHLQFPGVKTQVATGIIACFRPIDLAIDPDVLRQCRVGDQPPALALKPFTMGVAALKLRHYGEREGERVELRVEKGRVMDMPSIATRLSDEPSSIAEQAAA